MQETIRFTDQASRHVESPMLAFLYSADAWLGERTFQHRLNGHAVASLRSCSAGNVSACFSLFQLILPHRILLNQSKPAGFSTSRSAEPALWENKDAAVADPGGCRGYSPLISLITY
jgi:hypothetical protein